MTAKPTKRQSKQKFDPEHWPELIPLRTPVTPDQVLAEKITKQRADNNRKRLVARTKTLVAVVALALLSAVQNAFVVLPALWHGSLAPLQLIVTFNMVLQFATAGYFLAAKNPEAAALVLKFLLIFNGLGLFMGFVSFGSLLLEIIDLTLLYLAYNRMDSLKYGGE